MKKLSIFLLALFASAGITQAAIVDGSCGDNLTWSLNTKDSTLTITGSGEMTNWGSGSAPWYDYKSYIKYVSLPDGLTSIGKYAFSAHSSLSLITIPNSVTSIGDRAFYKSGLVSITIPNSVTSIGSSAFNQCKKITSITIPNSVTSIEKETFYGCTGLTYVTIPNSVTSIGESAFSGCSGLTSVTIPNSVTSIGKDAFRNCSGLTSVTIGNSVTSIGDWAFGGCSSLTSVTIPNSVTSIGSSAFYGCKIKNIIFSGTMEQWVSKSWNPIDISSSYSLSINDVVVTNAVIPNSVTSIGNSAFAYCSSLTSVTIPNSVTSIGSSALPSSLQRLTVYATTPPSANNAGVDRNTCKLYVPAESVEAYANALWWEDFASIRAIGSGFVVKFLDWNETILSSQEVDSGEDAIAPANPTHEGYTFIGWDKEFTNITEDLVVTAQYQINRFEVVFKDWDGTVLKSYSVDWNTAAIAPANPTREGYTFIGWDKEFSQVTENMTITAQYELGENKTVTVIFANGNDESEILSQQLTMKVPSATSISGFTFLGWYPVASVFAEPENTITFQAVYQTDVPASAPAVYTNPANPAQKLIKNGNVYILTEDKTYTITGLQVK